MTYPKGRPGLGPMKPIYLIRGWFWRRYWAGILAGIALTSAIVLFVIVVIVTIGRPTHDSGLTQDHKIQQLQQRVDSISLRLDEMEKKNGK